MANGRIAECEIYCSAEPNFWAAPVATVNWPNNDKLQTVTFRQPVTARYLKLVVEVGGQRPALRGHRGAGCAAERALNWGRPDAGPVRCDLQPGVQVLREMAFCINV